MEVIFDDLYFCEDCFLTIEQGQYPDDIDEKREKEISAGLNAWAKEGYLVHPGKEPIEFSWVPCDCCGSTLGGHREEYAVLGEK